MDLHDYLRVVRKGWRLVAVAVTACLAAAAVFCATATPQYQADTQLFVSTQGGSDAVALMQGGNFTQQRVKSYPSVVVSPAVLGPVIDDLDLDTTPRALAQQVHATAPLDTVLIDVAVVDPSPKAAARIANAVARQFVETVSELERPEDGEPSPVQVSVIRRADVPEQPVAPRIPLVLALGLLVGLALGLGVAVLREWLDTSVKTTEALAELGAPALGTTVKAAGSGSAVLLAEHSNSPESEALRQIRTNLQFVDVDNPPQVVVMTSSLPGEGKTTTSMNLALTMAMAGVRTILVEADLRLPKVSAYLGLEGAAGLTTVLAGKATLDDVLQPYGDVGLSVLPSGVTPPNPSELLGSRGMSALIADLRERADLIIFDTPPLLPVTDAAVLARQVDGAIVVVRHGRTTHDQLAKGLERLASVDARVLGGILSMVPARASESTYGYGYGYGPAVAPEADLAFAAEPAAAGLAAEQAVPQQQPVRALAGR